MGMLDKGMLEIEGRETKFLEWRFHAANALM